MNKQLMKKFRFNNMKHPKIIIRTIIIVFSLLTFTNTKASKKPPKKPNIIIIFTDDQGYSDVSCFGAKNYKTSNIDKLADQGMILTNFYAAAPVCTPSRASLLSGCYAKRIDMEKIIRPSKYPISKQRSTNLRGINPKEELLPELLKENGYKTACVGKWHLGNHKELLPNNHGFDEFFGIPYSNDMIPELFEVYPPLPLMKNNDIIEENPDQRFLTKRLTEYATDFIDRSKNEPFFLYLAHPMPHWPISVSPNFKGKSGEGLYADVMLELDWSVGEITKALKKANIEENTIVIFTSDNGPWLLFGNHAGNAEPLRNGKTSTFEGGQRVPFIIKWPNNVQRKSISNEVVTALDLLPTIMNITNGRLPNEKIDGNDITDLLKGNKKATGHGKPFFFYYEGELQAVRDNDWKLVLPHRSPIILVPGKDGEPGKSNMVNVPLSLYNLKDDVKEFTDLSEKYPEIVLRLKQLCEKFDAKLETEIRPCGMIAN